MTEPFRILIAVDGSAHALAAARCWSAWPERSSHPLHVRLLAVVPPLPHGWPIVQAEAEGLEGAPAALGQGPLESARECYAATRLAWETAVRVGAPASVIVEEAQDGHADLSWVR